MSQNRKTQLHEARLCLSDARPEHMTGHRRATEGVISDDEDSRLRGSLTGHRRATEGVISDDEDSRLRGSLTGQGLIDALQASPHRELDIVPMRSPMKVGDVRVIF
jgi:hypothetical protein